MLSVETHDTAVCSPRDAILRELGQSNDWITASHIAKNVPHLDKATVNRFLYEEKRNGSVDYAEGTPPKWRKKNTSSASVAPSSVASQENHIHCVIDLGNTHDCLQKLEPYAARNLISVAAYADLAFSGYGVSSKINVDNVQVFQADTPDKNSADVQIIWDVCQLVSHWQAKFPERSLHILVATKDLGFQRLKNLVEKHPMHKLTFVTNWESLRLYVE